MGKYFALSLALPQEEKIKTKRKFSKKTLKHFKRLNFSLAAGSLVVILAGVYLFQVSTLSTKGYEIRQLELQLNELKEANQRLELEAAGLQSIQSIDEEIQLLNLIPSGTVKHITGSDYAYSD